MSEFRRVFKPYRPSFEPYVILRDGEPFLLYPDEEGTMKALQTSPEALQRLIDNAQRTLEFARRRSKDGPEQRAR